MKRLGEAARHMTKEGRNAISIAQKARWARAKNDNKSNNNNKPNIEQLQRENELLKQEVSFYRNMYLNSDKKAA